MASGSNFVNGLEGKNYFSYKNDIVRVGLVRTTLGINPFELQNGKVKNKPVLLTSGNIVVAGEALEVDSTTGKLQPVDQGTAKYIAISTVSADYFLAKSTNSGNCLFSKLAKETDDKVCVIELKADDRILLNMQVNEAVKEGDELVYDTDHVSLKKAGQGDTAQFKVVRVLDQKDTSSAYNGVVVVMI